MKPIKSYVPIIRWRPAEIRAIKNLYPKDRAEITPLFEFILPPPKVDKNDFKKILEDSKSKFKRQLPDIAEDILKTWGNESFYVDVHLLDGEIRASVFDQILSSAKQLDLFSIPVTYIIPTISTDADMATRQVAIKFAKNDGRGLCIRIDDSHLNGDLSAAIDDFIKKENLDRTSVDILIDLKTLDEQTKLDSVLEKISHIPDMDKWRAVILSGSAFPKDLSEFEKHGNYKKNRTGWRIWQELSSSKKVDREVIFSDYTIQHPVYYGHMIGANTSASIRYTSDQTWEISRGEGLRNKGGAGYKQYPAHAKLLIKQPYYKGASFSYGDGYIEQIANSKDGQTGSPQTWLTAGINHHITFVVDQIANLRAKSK